MSLKYNDNDGVLHNVSGLNGLSGELVVGTTTTRSGTISVPALHNTSADPWKSLSVTFADPMPDTDYEVTFTLAGGYWNNVIINVGAKYKTGFEFDISVTSLGDIPNDTVLRINWKAFKLYTAEDITKAQSDIIALQNQNKTTFPTCTLNTTYVVSGSISLRRYGNVVQVTINALKMQGNSTSSNVTIATGLPASSGAADRCFIMNTSKANAKSNTSYPTIAAYGVTTAWVNQSGQLNFDINSFVAGDVIWGSFTYICND